MKRCSANSALPCNSLCPYGRCARKLRWRSSGGGASDTTGGAATDPNFSSVVLLAGNDNAANASTTFTDQSTANPKTLTRTGSVITYSNAHAPSGMTTAWSGDGTSSNDIEVASNADFGYGVGDFTIEFFAYVNSLAAACQFMDQRVAGTDVLPDIFVSTSGSLKLDIGGTVQITGANGAIVAANWYHIACSRVSGVSRLFINGTQTGSSFTDANNYATSKFRMMANQGGAAAVNGFMCCVRVTNGVGRYSGSFTPPTLPLPTR